MVFIVSTMPISARNLLKEIMHSILKKKEFRKCPQQYIILSAPGNKPQ